MSDDDFTEQLRPTPEELAIKIKSLSARDLARLNRLLRDTPGWGTTGVREPRHPHPSSPPERLRKVVH